MAAQTEDKKLDGAGLSVLWGLIKNIIPTVPTNVSSFTNDAAYVSQLETHNQNLVLASPNGASGLPSFRALAASDIPDLSGTYLTSASLNGYATQSWVTSQGFGTVSSIKVGTTSYSPSSGVVSLPAYPTTLPASDVYSWAKQSTKPSYSWSEIGSRPTKLSEFTNDSGFITGITSSMVTTALGFTPANSTSLSSYLPLSGGTMTGNIAMGSNSITGLGGVDFSNANGVTFDQYGNIKHKTTTSGNHWHIDKNDGTEILSVTTGGNVGIGTTSPSHKLHVNGGGYFFGTLFSIGNSGANIGVHVQTTNTGNNESCIQFSSSNSSGTMTSRGFVGWLWKRGMYIYNANAKEWLSIYDNGNGGIGTKDTVPSYKFQVAGAVGATAFTNTSDIRNKDFVSDLTMDIEQIANAPSFKFRWKTGDDKDIKAGSSAQYWQTVLPEIITEAQDEQRTLSMQYDVIALLSAITIAKEVVNDKERIRQLEQRVSQLEAQLAN